MKILDWKIIVVPLVVSFLMFIILGNYVINSASDHYYKHMRDLSIHLAQGYANSIKESINAEIVINQLLEEKLLVASETTALYTNVNTYEDLVNLALSLRVDEINLYDGLGKVILSTMGKDLVWQTYEGHPVYEFIQSDEKKHVEEIRENVITGIRYKYGYFKISGDRVVQIGVLAEKIVALLVDVNLQSPLDDMLETNLIKHAYFIDNTNTYRMSTDSKIIGTVLVNPDILSIINDNQIYGSISENDSSTYELYLPILVDGKRIGTLSLGHKMTDQVKALNYMTTAGLSISAIASLLIAYVIIMNYNKNKKLTRIAYLDKLTGLPNSDYLQVAYEQFQLKPGINKALLIINVKEFKTINMIYGYQIGDTILQEISNRLGQIVNEHCQLFRLDGDRFVCLYEDFKTDNELENFALGISENLRVPFIINSIKKYLHVHIGVIKVDDYNISISKLIQKALMTLDKHHLQEHHEILMYDNKIETRINREEIIALELQEIIEGVDTDRLFLVYQPQLHLKSNKIDGLEVLARLNSKHFGLVSPLEFIDIAEKNHLIYQLGQLIIRKACNLATKLNQRGYNDLRIAVNISGIQILHDGFAADTLQILSEYNMKDTRFEIEITESILLNDLNHINSVLQTLRNKHLTITLDDFGKGYSSFFRLSELQIDILKIDRSFISQISNKPESKVVAKEIIDLAHKFNLLVVAEGVENAKEWDYLIKHNCDYIQGFYYCKPLPENEILELLEITI